MLPRSHSLEEFLIYQDAQVTLYGGDNMTILPLLVPESVDVVVTSPPYNQHIDQFVPSGMKKEPAQRAWVEKISAGYEDSLPEDVYQAQQIELLNALYRLVKRTGSLFYSHKVRYREREVVHPMQWVPYSRFKFKQEIIWDRGGGIALNARMFYPCDERVYWLYKETWKWNQEAMKYGNIWSIPAQAYQHHPCPFPEELVARCLKATSDPGDVVLDPYAGSGTTLLVARRFGCRAIGIEQNSEYCQMIVERLTTQPELNFYGDPVGLRNQVD